jgi:hypothetical protein
LATAENTAGNPGQGITVENLFPLDAPEPIVSFQRSGRVLRHIFRRLTAHDFEAFYDNVEIEAGERGQTKSTDTDIASLVLYGRAIQRVEGYQTSDGRAPHELPGWPDCVPQGHRLTAIDVLLRNRGSIATDTLQLGADGQSASFVVARAASEPSTTNQCFAVTHHFRAPTRRLRKRFLRAMGKLPSTMRVLVSLYGELIVRIEGYSISGRELASKDEAVREVDTVHKLLAVSALLFPLDDSDPERRKLMAFAISADLLGMRKAAPATLVEAH